MLPFMPRTLGLSTEEGCPDLLFRHSDLLKPYHVEGAVRVGCAKPCALRQ